MSNHSNISDYSRYFSQNQKVYLVNMSTGRNSDVYESLSGVVTTSVKGLLELKITHGGDGAYDDEVGTATYKLTSEALGSGIQVLGDLTGIVAGNIFQFRIHGTLEMFQRRIGSRVELSLPISQMSRELSLALFKKEWKRVTTGLRDSGEVSGLVLQDTRIDLSAGGVGLTVVASNRPTPLSMFFIALNASPPVCALAEIVWEQRVLEGLRCGFRFVHILKADQQRINSHVSDIIRKSGGKSLDFKRNWVLVDKMVADLRKPE